MKRFLYTAACTVCLMLSITTYAQTIVDDAAKKVEPKKSFMQMLIDKIRFTKNAREKEKERMLALVEDLGLKDSITANANNIQLIIHELEKRENQHFDSLKNILNKINNRGGGTSIDLPPDGNAIIPADNPLTGNDLETLASKIMPLLKDMDVDEKEEKEKQDKLKELRAIRNANAGNIQTLKISDSVIKRYTVALKNKTEIFGFYDGAANSVTSPPVLPFLTSLIYYSLSVNETTGDLINKGSLLVSPGVRAAQAAGRGVYLAVLLQNKDGRSSFLYNTNAWKKCIDTVLELLTIRNTKGILLNYKNLRKKDSRLFTDFVRFASNALQQRDTSLKLFVTVPRVDQEGVYDVQALNEVTDKFFIDFATNTGTQSGPLAPLKGNQPNTIDRSFTWYDLQGVKENKMVLILPYRGTSWQIRDASWKQDIFTGYLNVSEVENKYGQLGIYDDATSSFYIDTVYPNNRFGRIWFDNEITLGEKYDYILQKGLGGAALFCINYDEGSMELRDELMYKFAFADTTWLKDSTLSAPVTIAGLSFWQKVKRYFYLYGYVLQNPCATCFERTSRRDIQAYLSDLKIDSLSAAQAIRDPDHTAVDPLKEQFNYINNMLATIIKYITLFLLVVSVGFICLYVAGLRYSGDDWKNKKKVAFILVLFSGLFVLSTFTWIFTSDLVPLFGVSAQIARVPDCRHDPSCINIPFSTLLLIIIAGILIGFLLFRYFITPLLKRKDVP